MERVSSVMELLVPCTTMFALAMSLSASPALSAFCRVREDISSRAVEVSSRAEACSEAPSARDWLDDATCNEAE